MPRCWARVVWCEIGVGGRVGRWGWGGASFVVPAHGVHHAHPAASDSDNHVFVNPLFLLLLLLLLLLFSLFLLIAMLLLFLFAL